MELPCQYAGHPFKKKTYHYDNDGLASSNPKYCSSCTSFLKFIKMMFGVAANPVGFESLYGNRRIALTHEMAHDLIDEVFDGYSSAA